MAADLNPFRLVAPSRLTCPAWTLPSGGVFLIRNLSRSRLMPASYALARLPTNPMSFQASRLHPALPTCAGGQATCRTGLAA